MKTKASISDKEVLLNFLKSGLSTRELDEQMGYDPTISKGWRSWKILQSYKLNSSDRGRLFCFRKTEALAIIRNIQNSKSRGDVEHILNSSKPRFFDKYKETYIVANSDEKVAVVLSGEARNITQSFFSPLKKVVGSCQFQKCDNTNLDTVHLQKSRPENLKSACAYGKLPNTNKYDVYQILLKYIHLHSQKRSLCFLCKKHHDELGSYERIGGKKLNDFRKIIISGL